MKPSASQKKVESKAAKEAKKDIKNEEEIKVEEQKIFNVTIDKKEVEIDDEKGPESFGVMVKKDKVERRFNEEKVMNKDLDEKNQQI